MSVETSTMVEAARRLPSKVFVPIADVGRREIVVTPWSGELPPVRPPKTIASAIFEADLHMTVMDLKASEPGAIKGAIRNPIDRRTALRHVFITRQKVDGDDPVVAQRRMGEVSPIIDPKRLYNDFRREAGIDYMSWETRQRFPVDVAGIAVRLKSRLEAGENADRAYFEAALALAENRWTVLDARNVHDAAHRRRIAAWRGLESDAKKEHEDAIAADRPRKFDGSFIENSPVQVVYKPYMHVDDHI